MPNIFHQSVEDILKAATPEQRLLWNYVFLRWGERVPVSQLVFVGPMAGTEFLTYSANKIYIAYQIEVTSSQNASATSSIVTLYDAGNTAFFYLRNASLYWDATAAAFRSWPVNANSSAIWFSRMATAGGYDYMKFVGYRISV